mmetsp:Transcript_4005/g.11593  ORF Transcript_4005/g.11593 Transcript_4005/m.11593 type:complete len:465 (+) Transcript_4005:3-1397(+)
MGSAKRKAAASAAAKRSTSQGARSLPRGAVAFAAVALAAVGLELSGVRDSLGVSLDAGGTATFDGKREPTGAEDIDLSAVGAHVKKLRSDFENGRPCEDENPSCASWAQTGECAKNKAFMEDKCRHSCGICSGGTPLAQAKSACEDTHRMCSTWASIGECDTNPSFMHSSCPVTCRLCQSDSCKDTREDCAKLAEGGGCYTRPGMREECAWTCVSCSLRDETSCKRDRSAPPAASPGSGQRMFESLAALEGRHAEGTGRVQVHSRDPWVVTVDDFLSDAEADALLAAGGDNWSRSLAGDGEQEVRTSSTSWCRTRCLQDRTVQAVQDRVARITGVPTENSEFMQVLRYEPGQFYKVHHDQNSPRASAWGPRLYTWFMYLSDVDAGGGTRFPKLNITVEPKKGRALLWPSVMDADPYERDDRTDHEALAVQAGVKFAANYWLHMYPFREKSLAGCDNAPYVHNWY